MASIARQAIHMRELSASIEGQITDPHRPLIAVAAEVSEAHTIPSHRHPRAQLLYAVEGYLRVGIGASQWVVSPRTGVWIPCGASHQVDASHGVSYRSIFISPSTAKRLPAHCGPITVDPLTRELMLEAATFGKHYRADSAESRLIDVLQDRLRRLGPETLPLPLPQDPRARRICEALLAQPSTNHTLEIWGRRVGASARTLARLFLRETGITFSQWVRRARLSIALNRMTQGETVTRVALDLGYGSASAFCAMFRQTLGTSPSRYLRGR